ncbi:MAG TPA: Rieske 2Fe-2S domain-containing protein [Acidimicrobiales bacterium]
MPVLSFDTRDTTVVVAGDRRWFLLPHRDGPLLVDGTCSHRGGPLWLGEVIEDGDAVRCPWHERCTGTRVLKRKAVPLVVRGAKATAVLPEGCERPVARRRL